MPLTSLNPHDQSVVGEVEKTTQDQVNQTVEQARETFLDWRMTSIDERAAFIEKFTQEFAKRTDELAKLITLEMGKPLSQAKDETEWIQDYLKYYYQQGPKVLADEIISKDDGLIRKVVREPYGVAGVIAPWNYPLAMPIWGIFPNLIAGNTVVFKPSEQTPLCGQAIADIIAKTDLPAGVFNIIHGEGQAGAALIDADIDLAWFTGSTKVGQEIFAKCGRKFIPCLIELGGSSPAIIFDDVDLDEVVPKIYSARFSNCGQVCSAIKRLFVHQNIFQEFVDRLTESVSTKSVGNPMDKVDVGPLVSAKQRELLEAQVKDAVDKGAKVMIGGQRPGSASLQNGNYFKPTILTNVNFEMRVLTEEVFGPTLPIVPFDTTEEAIKMANQTDYGLSAQIYTNDRDLAQKIIPQIRAGTVSVNGGSNSTPETPFGGYKKSGQGREGGKYGLHELTQIKYVSRPK